MIVKDTIKEVLTHLEDIGWSELIDKRWEKEVRKDILKEFPNIDKRTLNYILNLVLY